MAEGDLLSRARAGDELAFADVVSPHRRELHVHCYRMLGSFEEAEDAVQDALLAAWRGLASFEERSSIRTWLYRVATNTCLNLVRTSSRRPQMELPATAPRPTRSETVTWLEPYPDAMLSELPHDSPGAEQVIEQTEAISLAFITALQLLSPRARAVLVMRDVLGFSAREVADTLETTPEAVNMSLSRARASIQKNSPSAGDISAAGREQAELAQRLAGALAAHDIDAVVGLLAEDVRISMPPLPAVWDGRRNAVLFLTEVAFRLVPEARFVPTQANGQPALAVYTRDEINGRWHASGILVITLRGNEIAALTRFETHTLRPFGLPRVLLDH